MAAPRVLVVDNRDSFTFNVVQALREEAEVIINEDAVAAQDLL